GLAGGHPADERQPDLLPDGVLELVPREVPGTSAMTPLRARARKCSSAALAERKPSSCAISARVGGIPVSEMKRWMRRRICVWRGVRSDISPACLYIQLL